MAMFKLIASTLFISLLCTCTDKKSLNIKYKNLPHIEYCDLPSYQNQSVVLTAKYAGMMEYWALKPVKKCDMDLNVDFDTRNYYYKMPEKFKKRLNENANGYLIEAVGTYETGNEEGYGHLGFNKSRFLVTELLDVKVIRN